MQPLQQSFNMLSGSGSYLWPSWKSVNSASVGSSTVSSTQERWSREAKGGSVPLNRTSFHPEHRTLQMSMQSKYLCTSKLYELVTFYGTVTNNTHNGSSYLNTLCDRFTNCTKLGVPNGRKCWRDLLSRVFFSHFSNLVMAFLSFSS